MPKKHKSLKGHSQNIEDVELKLDSSIELNFRIKLNHALSDKQKSFIDISLNPETNIVLCEGPAGTSKTYLAVYLALRLLKEKEIDKIIYIRSIVESATHKLGSLPGEIDEKFKPWIIPFMEKCDELISTNVADSLLKNGYIDCIPVNFLRGSTFSNCAVIVDEVQNVTKKEAVTILTRFGKNCKLFFLGDSLQSDIGNSSFKEIYKTFNDLESRENGIITFEFDNSDIKRSELLKFLVKKLK